MMSKKRSRKAKNKFFKNKAKREKQRSYKGYSPDVDHVLGLSISESLNIRHKPRGKAIDSRKTKSGSKNGSNRKHNYNRFEKALEIGKVASPDKRDLRKKLEAKKQRSRDWLNGKIDQSTRDEICRKRRLRRAIMFALKKSGKGVSGPKTKKMSASSKVRC